MLSRLAGGLRRAGNGLNQMRTVTSSQCLGGHKDCISVLHSRLRKRSWHVL